MQDWEEDVLRVTRRWAGRRMPSDAISKLKAVNSPASDELDVATADAEILKFSNRKAGQFVNRTPVANPVAVLFPHSIQHFLIPCCAARSAVCVVVDSIYNSPTKIKEVPYPHDRHAFCAMQ